MSCYDDDVREQESKRLETLADLIQDQLNSAQTNIYKSSEKVERFKVRQHFPCCAQLWNGPIKPLIQHAILGAGSW